MQSTTPVAFTLSRKLAIVLAACARARKCAGVKMREDAASGLVEGLDTLARTGLDDADGLPGILSAI